MIISKDFRQMSEFKLELVKRYCKNDWEVNRIKWLTEDGIIAEAYQVAVFKEREHAEHFIEWLAKKEGLEIDIPKPKNVVIK